MKIINKLKVRILMSTLWRWSPKNYIKTISLFSETESDTVWQLVHGFYMLERDEHKIEFFKQILEEDNHAKQFQSLIKNHEYKFKVPPEEKKFLYKRKKDPIWKLLAYCYIGEKEAAEKFQHIYELTNNTDLKNTLRSIIHDETGHVGHANRILIDLGAKPIEIQTEFLKIKIKRKYESIVRNAKMILEVFVDLFLAVIYFIFGIFATRKSKLILNKAQQ